MFIFATSGKGGAGRSVVGANVAYRSALTGRDTCYLDFSFASPTAGTVFAVSAVAGGTSRGGTQSYLLAETSAPDRVDVWAGSDHPALRRRPPGAGQLVLFPGDRNGSEFVTTPTIDERCAKLLLYLAEEFQVVIVDLSAGRSFAVDMALAATAMPVVRKVPSRWLVFHKWTRDHVTAATGLVHDDCGLLKVARRRGHDAEAFEEGLHFVRTAVIDPYAEGATLGQVQTEFLRACDRDLTRLADGMGADRTTVPFDALLHGREQLICDDDLHERKIAGAGTVASFVRLLTIVVEGEEAG
ncbi:SCO2523 family variant P-loop protein [Micromonospora sp. NBC_00617]|uniref:SCO2523 family variant P-loop protein n=1 Tax=Micromonospora sp. NBC_00617 TaxID=2903587 RepID=UPI0030E5553B